MERGMGHDRKETSSTDWGNMLQREDLREDQDVASLFDSGHHTSPEILVLPNWGDVFSGDHPDSHL